MKSILLHVRSRSGAIQMNVKHAQTTKRFTNHWPIQPKAKSGWFQAIQAKRGWFCNDCI